MNIVEILDQIPDSLRSELFEAFRSITSNFREGRWEPSELNGGKLCEVVYSILHGYTTGSYPKTAFKPTNMVDACAAFEKLPKTFPRSIKIQIPRVLVSIYEVRNNRGVGHVGGEVNPNHMDATLVFYNSKWIMSEIVRVFHSVDNKTASQAIESLIEKETPIIWSVNDKKRVLDASLSMKQKTLLILYSDNKPVREEDLVRWTEHTNSSAYRRDVLMDGHKSRLWEYDKVAKNVTLSPIGINYVERELL